MGCCSSSESKYEDSKPASEAKPNSKAAGSKSSGAPDFGLAATHEVIKLLGKGGEGETWLVKDKETGEEVAAKLIKRPIPKAALAVIKRELEPSPRGKTRPRSPDLLFLVWPKGPPGSGCRAR